MFSDPQTVTVATVANPLPRVDTGDMSATYTNGDETLSLTISHIRSNKNRVRHMVRLDFNEIAADQFVPAENRRITGSTYLVIDEPASGFTEAALLNKVKGLVGWLSDANLTKVIAGES